MKKILFICCLFAGTPVFSQMRMNFNQYMLNPGLYNPAYVDVQTRFGAALTTRKQWMTGGETPLTVAANGFYRFTKNHSAGMVVTNDHAAQLNVLDIGFSYAYHAWITRKLAIGFGLKLGYQQRSLGADYVYFDGPIDPTLTRLKAGGFNMGAGLTVQSKNLTFGLGLPYMFNNAVDSTYIYGTQDNHFYGNIGYKVRFNDNFVLYPSIMVRGVAGAPMSMSFDGHVLIQQLVWFGGGYRSDNTIGASVGIFLQEGLRIIYSYENSYFTPHKRFDSSHEITLNYAHTIEQSPFAERRYRKKNGKMMKRPPRR